MFKYSQNLSSDEESCICNTLLRCTKKEHVKQTDFASLILSTYNIRYFFRGGFTLAAIVDEYDNRRVLAYGMTRQHPDDTYNITQGKMVALKRAVLEFVRDVFGNKAITETGYKR